MAFAKKLPIHASEKGREIIRNKGSLFKRCEIKDQANEYTWFNHKITFSLYQWRYYKLEWSHQALPLDVYQPAKSEGLIALHHISNISLHGEGTDIQYTFTLQRSNTSNKYTFGTRDKDEFHKWLQLFKECSAHRLEKRIINGKIKLWNTSNPCIADYYITNFLELHVQDENDDDNIMSYDLNEALIVKYGASDHYGDAKSEDLVEIIDRNTAFRQLKVQVACKFIGWSVESSISRLLEIIERKSIKLSFECHGQLWKKVPGIDAQWTKYWGGIMDDTLYYSDHNFGDAVFYNRDVLNYICEQYLHDDFDQIRNLNVEWDIPLDEMQLERWNVDIDKRLLLRIDLRLFMISRSDPSRAIWHKLLSNAKNFKFYDHNPKDNDDDDASQDQNDQGDDEAKVKLTPDIWISDTNSTSWTGDQKSEIDAEETMITELCMFRMENVLIEYQNVIIYGLEYQIQIADKICRENTSLIDDYIQFLSIQRDIWKVPCDINICPFIQQYYNRYRTMNGPQEILPFYVDLLNTIHCNLLHSSFTTPSPDGLETKLEQTRAERIQSKYNVSIDHSRQVIIDHIIEFLCNGYKVSRDNIDHFMEYLLSEEYDSESIECDIKDHDSGSNICLFNDKIAQMVQQYFYISHRMCKNVFITCIFKTS